MASKDCACGDGRSAHDNLVEETTETAYPIRAANPDTIVMATQVPNTYRISRARRLAYGDVCMNAILVRSAYESRRVRLTVGIG